MTADEIRFLAYSILLEQYPKKLSAGEIAEAIEECCDKIWFEEP